ncbi:MAG: hypothetical protein ABJP34_02820 [Erythrobacter sp.]
MRKPRWGRLIPITAASLVLAFMLGVQAMSGVVTRSSPDLALQLNPANGAAMGRLAFLNLSQAVQDGQEIDEAALGSLPLAQKAYRLEPINASSLAILARSQSGDEQRSAILAEALKLNRRSFTLQSLALEQHGKAEDLPRFVESLDQMLRVHPERLADFEPALTQALSQENAIPSFIIVFAKQSPWQLRFLKSAATKPSATPNLAELTRQIELNDDELNQVIIKRLSGTKNFAEALKHLKWVRGRTENSGAVDAGENSAWPARYAPLDWRFADSRQVRAQLSRDGSEVEVFVRSGNGGELMSRVVPAPAPSSTVRISHDIGPDSQLDSIRLELLCGSADTPFQTTRFADISDGVSFEGMPANCGFVTIRIHGRASTGRPAIRGAIQSLTVS